MAVSESEVEDDKESVDEIAMYRKHLEARLRDGMITRADASDARALMDRASEATGRKRVAFVDALEYILGFR